MKKLLRPLVLVAAFGLLSAIPAGAGQLVAVVNVELNPKIEVNAETVHKIFRGEQRCSGRSVGCKLP